MIENKNVRAVGETTISNLPAALKMLQTMLVPVDTKDPVTQQVTTERVSLSDVLKLFEAIGTLPPVGMPQIWATPNIPVGYLELNGDSFDMELYPELALIYPSGKLPNWVGRIPKYTPEGRTAGELEEDGNKAHSHTVAVSSRDLGTKTAESSGEHEHPLNVGSHTGGGNSALSCQNGGVSNEHIRASGVHSHYVVMGEHDHNASCSTDGQREVTVKGVFVTYIVRAR